HLDGLHDDRPMVLGGMSAGARTALVVGLRRPEVTGILAVCPPLDVLATPSAAVPVWITIGDMDPSFPGLGDAVAALEARGCPVHADVHHGVGHRHPDGFEAILGSALHWLSLTSQAWP